MIAFLAFLVAMLIALAVGAGVRRLAPVVGAVVPPRPDRWHSAPTPTMGGIAIVTGTVVGFSVGLAGPLLVILGLQVIVMALYATFVTFRLMGRDYDAAILAAGHVGFALSSTAAALAIMKAVTDRRGPSPLAFVVVPMVGAFFIDIANALVIQGYLALPLFGFPS